MILCFYFSIYLKFVKKNVLYIFFDHLFLNLCGPFVWNVSFFLSCASCFSLYGCSPHSLALNTARMTAPPIPITFTPPLAASTMAAPSSFAPSGITIPFTAPTSPRPHIPPTSAAPRPPPLFTSSIPTPSAPLPISQRYRPYTLSPSQSSSVPTSPSLMSGLSTPTQTSAVFSNPQPAPLPSPSHRNPLAASPFSVLPGSPTVMTRPAALASWMTSRYFLTVRCDALPIKTENVRYVFAFGF